MMVVCYSRTLEIPKPDFGSVKEEVEFMNYSLISCALLGLASLQARADLTVTTESTPAAPPSAEGHFLKGTWSVAALLIGALDIRGKTDRPAHDLGLASIQAGYNFTGLQGESTWYYGYWQIAGEVFGGAQFSPRRYVVGALPVLSYNFVVNDNWVPYIEGGAGVAFTDIGHPDLSTTFQFTEQGGVGFRYHLDANTWLRVGSRVLHISNGGIKEPNTGVTTANVILGLEWFY